MEAQLQIRRNAEEAQEQAEDVQRWAKQQKEKEAKLKHGSQANGTSKTAPVRSGFAFKQSKSIPDPAKPAKKAQPTATHAAGHTYDNYGKRWDAFDPETEATSVEPVPTASQNTPAQPKTDAPDQEGLAAAMTRTQNQPKQKEVALDDAGWKERGNELFKKGSFAEAKTAYSRSLSQKQTAVVYANRAQACLKLGQAAQAEKDCSEALELFMQYIKAWQRRATARKQLGNNFGAAEDFEQVTCTSQWNSLIDA